MTAEPQRIKTISELHQLANMPRPEHPLISVINMEDVKTWPGNVQGSRTLDFYTISMKRTAMDILSTASSSMMRRAVFYTLLHPDGFLARL